MQSGSLLQNFAVGCVYEASLISLGALIIYAFRIYNLLCDFLFKVTPIFESEISDRTFSFLFYSIFVFQFFEDLLTFFLFFRQTIKVR